MAFHYTDALTRVIDDLSRCLPDFAHVDVRRVAVAYTRARKRTTYGTFAKTVPLAGVSPSRRLPHDYVLNGRPVLYAVYFYLPRFHDQSFEDKIITIVHELFHMSPAFDGTLRLFDGRNYAHGPSRDEYEAHIEPLAHDYLRARNGAPHLDFLKLSTEELVRTHGALQGFWLRMPT